MYHVSCISGVYGDWYHRAVTKAVQGRPVSLVVRSSGSVPSGAQPVEISVDSRHAQTVVSGQP